MSDYASNTDLDAIEQRYGVNIEVCDVAGETRVYTYTEYGECLGFEFYSMNVIAADVMTVAAALDNLRTISNRRPLVGRLVKDV
jgi:hypothetical protein